MVLLPSIIVPGSSITKLKNVTFLMYTKLKMKFLKNANMIGCYNVHFVLHKENRIRLSKSKNSSRLN